MRQETAFTMFSGSSTRNPKHSRKRRNSPMTLSLMSVLQTLLLVLATLSFAATGDDVEDRQVAGIDACTCSPTEFSFTINFAGKCDESDVVPSDAIARVRCIVSDETFQPITPAVPTVVTQIDILEFGLNLTLLSDTTYRGPYEDGDTFDFTSITGTPPYTGDNVPQIFQISITGLNENDDIVRNSLGVVYTNACNVEPVFTAGEEFGWLIFTEVSDPLDQFCQAQPTAPPVLGPPSPAPAPSDECSCSPLEFTFRFDFTGECPGNIMTDAALERVGCVIDNDFGDQVMDNTPTRVLRVTIEEVTTSGSIMKLDITNEVFLEGDTFTYTSASDDGFLTPVSLQVVLEGENDIGVGVFNVIRFEYTNECGVEVVFPSDAAIGWLLIDEYAPGREEDCQEPTPTPTLSPSALPTASPTDTPTASTTVSPTDSPTAEPTPQPVSVASPTQMIMTPMPTPAPQPTPEENGATPTQMTMPPVPDDNMSFDVNRLLDDLMKEDIELDKTRNNMRRRLR